jgi:predicted RNase H-like HicB family nuclease
MVRVDFFLTLRHYYHNRRKAMELQYTYWQDGEFFVGFLNDYPDDSTQGVSLAELEEALVEVFEIKQEEKKHLAEIRKTGTVKITA